MTLFKTKNSQFYYFHWYDEQGRQHLKSTGTTNYEKAMRYALAYKKNYAPPEVPTLFEEMQKYMNIETNPKYKLSQIDGSNYGIRYAIRVVSLMRGVQKALETYYPEILGTNLDKITRHDANLITEAIVKYKGRCRTAQMMQQQMKVLFTFAFQEAVIDASPFVMQRVIRYQKKKKCSLDSDWIAWVISRPDLFLDINGWAFFTILATTGMRRSEALALSREQVKNGIIYIDRALSGDKKDSPNSLPKWGIVRTIPASQITLDAIRKCTMNINGRYFYQGCNWVQTVFDSLKATLNGIDQEHKDQWVNLTPHVLRHSFNTNLLVAGGNAVMIAEYCGWEHQGIILDMQENYTHFRVKHLQKVADLIDDVYTYKEAEAKSL